MLKLCQMLYVSDVARHAAFWEAIGLVPIQRAGEGQSETVIFATDQAQPLARIQLWNRDFIKTVSPEVADMKGSLLFVVDDLESWHARVVAVTNTASDINQEAGLVNFHFQDPDGNYYAFAKSELPDA